MLLPRQSTRKTRGFFVRGPSTETWVVVVLGIGFAGLAGCMQGPGSSASLHPDIGRFQPILGDSFRYETEDGEWIEGTFVEVSTRADAGLALRPAVIMNFTYGSGGNVAQFEEAFDPSSGQVIQQVAYCGQMFARSDGIFACDRTRATILFGATGHAGAFGAAPLWGSQDGTVKLSLLDGGFASLRRLSPGDCESWEATSSSHWVAARYLPWTVVSSKYTVCRSVPVPVEFSAGFATPFSPAKIDLFQLVEYEPGEGQPWDAANTAQQDVEPLLDVSEWPSPYFASQSQDSLTFPLDEAHLEAMNLSPRYRAVMQSPNSGILRYFHSYGGGSSLPGFESSSYDAELIAWAPGQDAILVSLTKQAPDNQLIPPSFSLSGESNLGPRPVDWSSQSASLEDAIQAAVRITGQSFQDENAEFTHNRASMTPFWTSQQGPVPNYQGGPLLTVLFPPSESEFLPVFFCVSFDGALGVLSNLDVNPETLPLRAP